MESDAEFECSVFGEPPYSTFKTSGIRYVWAPELPVAYFNFTRIGSGTLNYTISFNDQVIFSKNGSGAYSTLLAHENPLFTLWRTIMLST